MRQAEALRRDLDLPPSGAGGYTSGLSPNSLNSPAVWLAVALGGALGCMARHAVNMIVSRLAFHPVPLAVAAVNVVGCLAIGALAGAVATERWVPGLATRAFVFVGLLGGFTTFSSFGLDVFTLVQEGKLTLAALNVVGQVMLGLLGVFVGYGLITR